MEDISRELEREIARAKPSPHKASKQRRILIIDDFGSLSSGDYLKTLVYIFGVLSLVGLLGAAGFYSLFTNAQKETIGLKDRLAGMEKKLDRLTNDKEILMARLVMAGKKPDLATAAEKTAQTPPAKEKQSGIMPKPVVEKKEEKPEEKPLTPVAITPPVSEKVPEPETVPDNVVELPVTPPVVSVEKFTVVQGKNNDQLIVRFDIRNVSPTSKEISGRIFAVIKPKNGGKPSWIVTPNGRMEKGVPGPYAKGQYFSISRFKPVKFTVDSQASPKSFTTASIYIFGDDEKLLFEDTIQIKGEE